MSVYNSVFHRYYYIKNLKKNSKNNESIFWYRSKRIWMLCNIFTFLGWWPFPLCSLQRRCVGNENIQCKAEFEYSQFFTPQYIPIPQPFINVYRKFKSLEWFVKFWFQFGTWTSIICFCKYSNWLQQSGKMYIMSVAFMFSSCNQGAQLANWYFYTLKILWFNSIQNAKNAAIRQTPPHW